MYAYQKKRNNSLSSANSDDHRAAADSRVLMQTLVSLLLADAQYLTPTQTKKRKKIFQRWIRIQRLNEPLYGIHFLDSTTEFSTFKYSKSSRGIFVARGKHEDRRTVREASRGPLKTSEKRVRHNDTVTIYIYNIHDRYKSYNIHTQVERSRPRSRGPCLARFASCLLAFLIRFV